MKNKTKGLLMQLPAIILLVITLVGAFYAKLSNIYPLKWATPITILVIVVLYFWGMYFERKADKFY